MSSPATAATALDRKVAFLRSPRAYDPAPATVETIETHMSWVFLTPHHAYKLKKPVRWDGLDFSTQGRRRRHCLEELRLNRRLASDIYLDVVPLAERPDGSLRLGGRGRTVDWVVRMRRLPRDRMLDTLLARGEVRKNVVRPVAAHLARFFRDADRSDITSAAFHARLEMGTFEDLASLTVEPAVAGCDLQRVGRNQLEFLRTNADLLARRVEAGRIVDGHGDLRPEHICVGPNPPPTIIDCLEFNASLRTLDPADELAYLGLECERAGARAVGEWFLEVYTEVTGDPPPGSLLQFYRRYRAIRRARLAVMHMREPGDRLPRAWAARARDYLELAEEPAP